VSVVRNFCVIHFLVLVCSFSAVPLFTVADCN
jgi:hypothetical protein